MEEMVGVEGGYTLLGNSRWMTCRVSGEFAVFTGGVGAMVPGEK